MEFETYVRRPFEIEAVQITRKNIYDVAQLVGEVRKTSDGRRYILVDQRLVPNMERVYPGFYLTKLGDNVRCYTQKAFEDQFIKVREGVTEVLEDLEEFVVAPQK